ncbi:MAG TPA: hypothetical protein VL172_11320 [Kofleriaceae bacterium]|nr:hypothetical protein [Kofleriaceae bacterium]
MAVRSELVASRLFDPDEIPLIDQALENCRTTKPEDAAQLQSLVDRLSTLNNMLAGTPSLRSEKQLALDVRNESTLIDHLTRIDGLGGDLELPFKATLSRTFLLAKIQFLRGLVKASTGGATTDEQRRVCHDLREELAQSIYTLLAEELLLALLRKPNVTRSTKRKSADQLITIWDNAQMEIDDFSPILESAWHARNRITSKLGSLMGASEYFRLVAADCAPQFLDFFSRQEVSRSEGQAFEEFLFNMTYEELQTLGEAMRREKRETMDPAWAAEIVGRPIEELDHSGEIDPMALYRSYYRRQLAADFRIMAGTEGPRRTAEAYMMIYLLDQKGSSSHPVDPRSPSS